MEKKKIATRESYGSELVAIGEENTNVVVLEADLSKATKTSLFQDKFPERHINCGIAEGNMAGVAAGLATTGKIPIMSTFAMFAAGRAFEQIRNSIGYPRLNVKIGATHAGITVGEDGATHQCIEDFSLMRAIPGMVVLSPSDDIEARACLRAAVEYEGPVYMRFGRLPVPIINDYLGYKFEIGKGNIVREGKDVTLIATGICLHNAIEVAEILSKEGIEVEIINICTIKPLDETLILNSAQKTKKVVTVEEHSIIGGLGSAVCDLLAQTALAPVKKIGIQDVFGQSGNANELLTLYGLDTESITKEIRRFLGLFL